MTPRPTLVGRWTPLSSARALMAREGIAHLPVVEDGAIVGLLSAGESWPGAPPAGALVDDVMTKNPVIVGPGASVAGLTADMRRLGHRCVLVAVADRLVGILTWTDAQDALARAEAEGSEVHSPTCDRWGHVVRS